MPRPLPSTRSAWRLAFRVPPLGGSGSRASQAVQLKPPLPAKAGTLNARCRRRAWFLIALLAIGSLPVFAHEGRPPEPHDRWTAWSFGPGVLVGLALSAWFYWRGAQRLGAQRLGAQGQGAQGLGARQMAGRR